MLTIRSYAAPISEPRLCGSAGTFTRNSVRPPADVVKAEVFVDKYPSGSSYTTLGSANGLSDPAGVAVH